MPKDSEILVSIVIPVYNVEKYLRECLDSVICQTLREIEIICVNDGSTDGSFAILEEYAKRDSRIQIVNQPNGGLSNARNAGIARVKGRYTYFVDSDDTIDVDLCRMTFISAEYYAADVLFFDIVPYDARCDLELVKDLSQPSYYSNMNKTYTEDHCVNVKEFLAYIWCPMKLFRTGFLRENNLFFPEHIFRGEDLLFHWQVLFVVKKIGVLPAHLYYYRNRLNSLMQTKRVSQTYIFSTFEELKKKLLDHNLYETYKNEYIRQKLYDLFYSGFVQIQPKMRSEIKQQILNAMTEDEWNYISDNEHTMTPYLQNFYRSLRRETAARLKFNLWWYLQRCSRRVLSRLGVGVLYVKVKHIFAKHFSQKYVEQNRKLCDQIVELQEKILLQTSNITRVHTS